MKFLRLRSTLLGLVIFVSLMDHAQNAVPQLGNDAIPAIIKTMTLEEKAKLVVGKGFSIPGLDMGQTDQTPDKVTGISGHTTPVARLGIPSLELSDGTAGSHRFMMTAKDSTENMFSSAWTVWMLRASSWSAVLGMGLG